MRAFSTKEEQRPDECSPQALLHAKIFITDSTRTYIGSANLTGNGLGANLEMNVGLERPKEQQFELLLQNLVASDWFEQIHLG